MKTVSRLSSFALSLLCVGALGAGLLGCGSDNVLRGKVDGYKKIAKQAKDNGAIRCAW